MIARNLILDTDSYKLSHAWQYPEKTEKVFSYLESRGGRFSATVFFGLQYILKEYFTQTITEEMVTKAEKIASAHGLPFNKEGWLYIAKDLKGKLPLKIKAVPEGSVVPTHNVLMTVENTDPKCFWLTSYVETALMRVWYPITVATHSYFTKKIIWDCLVKTSDEPGRQIGFKLHDFGARGVSSQESAGIGGAAHLVNFLGTDTIVGLLTAIDYYGAEMPGFSIPAAEHSTITAWGRDKELDAYRNMLKQFAKPGSLVAVVSDSYDIHNAVDNLWGKALREEVVKSGATVVIRPDSGDPATIVLKVMKSLEENYGYYINSKGYKVLKNVRVIQGDGVNEHSIKQILEALEQNEFSADNIAFGMGGNLLQNCTRDTQKFAYKCSAVVIEGKHRDVCKNPVTDPGKKSKAGRLDLIQTPDGNYKTLPYESPNSVLMTVFENGLLTKEWTWEEIRKRSSIAFA